MSSIIVIGYRDDLDQALRHRGLDPHYIVQAPARPPENRRRLRVTDIENAQELLRAVLAANLQDTAGVLTVHEMGVFGAAFLRGQLGLPGNADATSALSFRDKYLQKSRLPPEVKRARCRYTTEGTPYEDLVGELGTPFVLKPATGAGSLRTSVVRSPEDYARAVSAFPDPSSDVGMVAESFVDASEVYVDGIWQDGTLQWSSLSRNHIAPLRAVQGGVLAAHVLDRSRHAELFQQAETVATQALTALDAPDCVFHLEAFRTAGGLTFGECAIRLPGALSPQVNKLTYGVDLFDAEISLALGEEVVRPRVAGTPERFHGYVLLRRPEGGGLTRADFERNFTFDEIVYTPDVPAGPYGKVGHAIVSDPDELKLEKTLEDIARFNESGGA
ncbi:ATP-grasp domain-containing protein [Streptomyces spectabilis]|uniref:ATP-grasp domain-containing protein n=1 Tax=Streptomyces spectabilis TaxID=68270 RepID=A0A516RHB7_STRST|nr:ATP-grasp domain-containing protein [Streptomyces spectabilis]QDQ15046.1 ATP-grasp domain-containing protein [Streptomyces spectabilis]